MSYVESGGIVKENSGAVLMILRSVGLRYGPREEVDVSPGSLQRSGWGRGRQEITVIMETPGEDSQDQ